MRTQSRLSRPWPSCQRLVIVAVTLALGCSSAWAKKPPKPPPEPQSAYRMIDLGDLGDGQSQAWSINDAGWVVGKSYDLAGNRHAFVVIPQHTDGDLDWFAEGESGLNDLMVDLGVLGGGANAESGAYGINDDGQVVGWSSVDGSYAWHAFLWQPDTGQMLDLGTMGDATTVARSINNLGQVVGDATQGGAFLINPIDTDANGIPDTWYDDADDDGFNDLMIHLGSDGWGGGLDINDSGEIVGTSSSRGFLIRPADQDGDGSPDCWFADKDGDGINDLMILLPPVGSATDSFAQAMNAHGLIAGVSGDDGVLWQVDSARTVLEFNLGHIKGYAGTGAWDLNDGGQAVGFAASTLRGEPPFKFKYAACLSENGRMIKLADRVVDWGPFDNELSRAFGISELGEIVGEASAAPNGWRRAFIAIPVP